MDFLGQKPLNMTLEADTRNGVRIIILGGNITEYDGSPFLGRWIARDIEDGHKNFILDLSAVRHIDSSGLGEILAVLISAARVGGKAILCRLTDQIRSLFYITKILDFYEVRDTIEEALESFESKSLEDKSAVNPEEFEDGLNSYDLL